MPPTLTAPHVSLPPLRDCRLYLPNPTFGKPSGKRGDAHPDPAAVALHRRAEIHAAPFLVRETREALPGAYIDMAFLPRPADAAVLSDAGIPLILGTRSHGTPMFDVVFVSNWWLLEQVNFPFLFSRSGVSLWAHERGGQWPPIILGGSNATAAHALVL